MAQSRYGRDILTAFKRAVKRDLNINNFDEATTRIQSILDNDTSLLSSASAMLSIAHSSYKLSYWYRRNAVVALSGHDTKLAFSALRSVSQCDLLYWHFLIKGGKLRDAEGGVFNGGFRASNCALSLCIAMSIGLIQESEALYIILNRIVTADDSFFHRNFSTESSRKTPSVALRFYERSVLGKSIDCQECGLYASLIENYDNTASTEFSAQVLACCDYHVANSRDMTKNKSYEFGDSFFKVYPAEILMVLYRRRSKGIEIDLPSHKLIALPTFHVFGVDDISSEQNPLLVRLMQLVDVS